MGLKHESLNKERFEIGKLKLFIHNYATFNQTVGTEFSLDWKRRALEARIGLSHKFDDLTLAKFKIDHHGSVNALIKHKVSKSVSVTLATGFNVKSDVLQKSRQSSLPFGISFDINI